MIFAQLGMTLMLVALFGAAVAEHLVGQPLYDANRPVLAAGVGAFGVLLILVGVVAAKRRQNKKLPDPGKLVEFLEPRFWGGVVILLGVLTFNFQTWGLDLRWLELRARMDGQAQIVQAREPAETNQTAAPTPPKAVAVPAIPSLVMMNAPLVLVTFNKSLAAEPKSNVTLEAATAITSSRSAVVRRSNVKLPESPIPRTSSSTSSPATRK